MRTAMTLIVTKVDFRQNKVSYNLFHDKTGKVYYWNRPKGSKFSFLLLVVGQAYLVENEQIGVTKKGQAIYNWKAVTKIDRDGLPIVDKVLSQMVESKQTNQDGFVY